MRTQLAIAAIASSLGLAAAPTSAQTQTPLQPVRLKFAATVGGAPAACGASYEEIGVTKSAMSFVDFRFYVSRVRLVRADGTEQPVTLAQDGLWQLDDVALLDFEDGTGGCANGTAQTRDVVEGRVPAGEYVGVRFDLGLPFEKNHRESTLQPSPLNLTRMFWSWNAGYKFMRMDIRTTGQPKGWMLHLGSTGCTPTGKPTIVPESCTYPNIPTIDLPAFDIAADTIELDVKSLLASSDVDVNTPKTAVGCMSAQSDPECGPIFGRLGLAWGEAPAAPQSAFKVRRVATASR
jgi:uncharacterized repeat protein (TIGR04052 family)